MKKRLTALLLVSLMSTGSFAHDIVHYNQQDKFTFVNQLGVALEERNTNASAFVYFNQVIYDKFYWEVRGNYVRNFIVTSPPKTPGALPDGPIISALTNTPVTAAVPAPTADDQDNLDGFGVVGKLGWLFRPSGHVTVLPYLRLQWYKNNSTPYKDDLGNKIESDVYGYFLGMKVGMDINDIFGIYVDYYGGIQNVNFDVSGYYTIVPSDLDINELSSTFEMGATYKLSKCLTFIPYIQLIVSSHEPSFNAYWGPIQNTGLTTYTPLFGAKIAYKWPVA
ncbi:MAG: hypothetical protein JSR17_06750 [Proteobacteria bacterium]|nr:hypothetical protein [Pseudomonadota bacterium]